MNALFNQVPQNRILNADETGWKLIPKGVLSRGETGVDNMSRNGAINDKNQVTVRRTLILLYDDCSNHNNSRQSKAPSSICGTSTNSSM